MTNNSDEPDLCALSLNTVGPTLVHDLGNVVQGLQLIDIEDSMSRETKVVLEQVRDRLLHLVRHIEEYIEPPIAGTGRLRLAGILDCLDTELRARKLGHAYTVSPGPDWGDAQGDERAVAMAVTHLVAHLARRVRPGEQVHVASWSDGLHVGFRLTAAVTSELTAALASPLARRERGETGLETAIAVRIARAHGGEIALTHQASGVEASITIRRSPIAAGG